MGFIDYHGSREKLYADVVEYADMQASLERKRRDEQDKAVWFTGFMGDKKYASADAGTLLKLAAKAYQDATDRVRSIEGATAHQGDKPDAMQLWQDLWLDTSGRCMEDMGLDDKKQTQFLDLLMSGVLKLEVKTPAERHLQEIQDNRRYRRYMDRCFSLQENAVPEYWRWLAARADAGGFFAKAAAAKQLRGILDSYDRYICFLTYYIYKGTTKTPPDLWVKRLEAVHGRIGRLYDELTGPKRKEPRLQRCINPLYDDAANCCLPVGLRVLLFGKSRSDQNKGDPDMIEDLYEYLKETPGGTEPLKSVLPDSVRNQIRLNTLPSFKNDLVSGLHPGETIHYMDHMLLYQPAAPETQDGFTTTKGTFIITDKRLYLQCAGGTDLSISELSCVLRYDMVPEVLEIRAGGISRLIRLPDPDLVYKVLYLLANEAVRSSYTAAGTVFGYAELVEKADLDACIFAFESIESSLPEGEFGPYTQSLMLKLKGLKKTVEKYPDTRSELHRFLEYYIPEVIRIMASYQDYRDAGLNQAELDGIRTNILDSIRVLDSAIEQKILQIYKIETMNTAAQAEALRTILGQDGFTADRQVLVH